MSAMRNAMRGTSLIEAMLAIALLATVMLAVAGSQLAMARAQRATIWRERALWMADARIERLRVAAQADDGLAARAAATLPGGAMLRGDGPGGVRYAVVGWRGGNAATGPRCDAAGRSVQPPSCVRIPYREADADAR
ncbi:type IV pilus modification PilV family protein [Burkholderia sp. LMG 21824]|uniref:type IV pilus modification PilV family protein n=1 Tax=Burkholderia sp. LMG 21824 TaxID=3158172 RepID=UPI003C2EF15C